MTPQDESSILEDVLKVLTLREPEGLKVLLNAAMKIERGYRVNARSNWRSRRCRSKASLSARFPTSSNSSVEPPFHRPR